MRYYDNSDLFGINDNLFYHRFLTKKYDVVYAPSLKKIGIMRAHWFWSNRIFRYYKDRKLILKLDSTLFFSILPNIQEIKTCNKWMSDKIIDQKIERLFTLRTFM